MKKIGIIHTTQATVSSLSILAARLIPELKIINILDDSMLEDMRDGCDIAFVRERWLAYAGTLERLGVDAVLSACSTVGEFAEEANGLLTVPVYRIDEAMCEKAVENGRSVSVLATLSSTLEPTVRLIRRKAAGTGREIRLRTVLIKGSYEALTQGDRALHDVKIATAVQESLRQSEVVVLAQASMASAIPENADKERILTSPELGLKKLRDDLQI